MRVTQQLSVGSVEVDLIFDVLNVLNLINREWGQVQTVNSTVRVIRVDGRFADGGLPGPTSPLEARFVGPLERSEGGGVRAIRPYVPAIGPSQWQAQFGVQLRFN